MLAKAETQPSPRRESGLTAPPRQLMFFGPDLVLAPGGIRATFVRDAAGSLTWLRWYGRLLRRMA